MTTNTGMEALIPLVNKLQDAFTHTGTDKFQLNLLVILDFIFQ